MPWWAYFILIIFISLLILIIFWFFRSDKIIGKKSKEYWKSNKKEDKDVASEITKKCIKKLPTEIIKKISETLKKEEDKQKEITREIIETLKKEEDKQKEITRGKNSTKTIEDSRYNKITIENEIMNYINKNNHNFPYKFVESVKYICYLSLNFSKKDLNEYIDNMITEEINDHLFLIKYFKNDEYSEDNKYIKYLDSLDPSKYKYHNNLIHDIHNLLDSLNLKTEEDEREEGPKYSQ